METYIGLILSVLLNIISLVLIGRYRVQENEKDVTEEEIRQMVDAGGDSGTIDENVKEMLNNIFELSNSSAGDIATHRTDIVAVPVDATLEEIKNVTAEEKYSRIVVYDDNIDNIVGVYHVKDMVKYILADVTRGGGAFPSEGNPYEALFYPIFQKGGRAACGNEGEEGTHGNRH